MATERPRDSSKPDSRQDIAAADWLTNNDSGLHSPNSAQGPMYAAGSGEVFALADPPSSDDVKVMPPVPPVPHREKPATQPREGHTDQSHAERTHEKPRLQPADLVEQTWSRWAEWGPNLLLVCGWLFFVFISVYFLTGLESLGPALFTFVIGGIVAVVLSYPILITLERPVRVTPEQAVRDYYSALSHHLPHLRRMWLLLSTAGRISNSYGSFEGFKSYWADRLQKLRDGHAGQWTPLVFEVVNFKAEKSAGKTQIDAEFTLKISVRGQRQAGPIHTIPMRITLARGADKMWYLDNGTLARAHS